MELHQLIYELFKRQIMFGVHHFEDTLPTMKEASEYFFVSVDTVRKAYLKLKQEGYITLSTGVGAVVSVRYGNRAIRRNIQNFFARPIISAAAGHTDVIRRQRSAAIKRKDV